MTLRGGQNEGREVACVDLPSSFVNPLKGATLQQPIGLRETLASVTHSTFSSPFLSAMLTFGLWVAGHFNADLRRFEEVMDSPVAASVARVLYYLLPNLSPFDVKAEVVHAVPVPASHVLLTLAYAAVYIAALLVAAMAIFRRRDFK